MKHLSAHALPTVLVVSVLILIGLAVVFQFWNINSFYYIRYHAVKQQKMHLSSALALFCNDSLFMNQIQEDKKFQLYEDAEHSLVHLDYFPWGLYECVNTSNFDQSIQSSQLIGKVQETHLAPALWVCDRDHSLSLSGEADVTGEFYLSQNGIDYMNLSFDRYRGDEIQSSFLHTSERELPPIDSTYIRIMNDLRKATSTTSLEDQVPAYYYSFFNEPLHALLPNEDEELYAKGRLVLYGDRVRIPASWRISDILLVAKSVIVEEGFNGALQIIVSDTVVVEKGASLRYPSGIYLQGNNNKTYLHLKEGSLLEGYALVEGDVEGGDGFVVDIHYRQDKGSQLAGLLYVNGIAHLEGQISGAAYLKECYYLSGEHMYMGLIYNAKIERNNNLVFPILFKDSPYKRRVIKKVE